MNQDTKHKVIITSRPKETPKQEVEIKEYPTESIHLESEPFSCIDQQNEVCETEIEESISYRILPEGTMKRKPMLVASNGYAYNLKVPANGLNGRRVHWRCVLRYRPNATRESCPAAVIMVKDTRGNLNYTLLNDHTHTPDLKRVVKCEVFMKMKQMSKDPSRPLSEIIDQAMNESLPEDMKYLIPDQKRLRWSYHYHKNKEARRRKKISIIDPQEPVRVKTEVDPHQANMLYEEEEVGHSTAMHYDPDGSGYGQATAAPVMPDHSYIAEVIQQVVERLQPQQCHDPLQDYGKMVANELADMEDMQRKLAKKLINEILALGSVGSLQPEHEVSCSTITIFNKLK